MSLNLQWSISSINKGGTHFVFLGWPYSPPIQTKKSVGCKHYIMNLNPIENQDQLFGKPKSKETIYTPEA